MKTINVKVSDLSKHPLHAKIYAAKCYQFELLVESIRESRGLLVPIVINSKNQIIDGVQRWLAYKEIGLKTIPATVTSKAESGDAAALEMIAYNRHKRKTIVELWNEIQYLKKSWGKKQGERTDLLPDGVKESTRKRIAMHMNLSEGNIFKLEKIATTDKSLLNLVDTQEISIHEAYERLPKKPAKVESKTPVNVSKQKMENHVLIPEVENVKCKCPNCGHEFNDN